MRPFALVRKMPRAKGQYRTTRTDAGGSPRFWQSPNHLAEHRLGGLLLSDYLQFDKHPLSTRNWKGRGDLLAKSPQIISLPVTGRRSARAF